MNTDNVQAYRNLRKKDTKFAMTILFIATMVFYVGAILGKFPERANMFCAGCMTITFVFILYNMITSLLIFRTQRQEGAAETA